MINRQRSGLYLFTLNLLCITSLVQAFEFNVHRLLKQHYLSKFIENNEPVESFQFWGAGVEELQPYPLSDRMTPLRTRTILLHYLCPECAGRENKQNIRPLSYHSNVWLDTQVFQIPGKAHIYDMAFPGMTTLGEVYGAYQLVAGPTRNLNLLNRRQKLIRQLQEPGVANQLRERLKELEQYLPRGLAIFDRQHPFYSLSGSSIFFEEAGAAELLSTSPVNGFMPFLGNSKPKQSEHAVKQGLLKKNLDGAMPRTTVYLPYASLCILLGASLLNIFYFGEARALAKLPGRGCQDRLKSVIGLAGYSQPLITSVGTLVSVHLAYQQHAILKNIREVLTRELISVKPFLEKLFLFEDAVHLPLVNFSLIREEQKSVKTVLDKINHLSTDNSHFFQDELASVASALRWLLFIRELIVRYLVNVARLDFYIAVAEGIRIGGLWSFVQYDTDSRGRVSTGPELAARKLWNPMLSPDKAITSNLVVGGDEPSSIVLTGANASGKTTLLRSIGINAIFMAQTLGVAAARSFRFRPYTHFDSLMEKRDQYGRSSYETEVDAVARVWAVTNQLSEDHRSLILADELFRTTNPGEGASASLVLVRKLGSLPHVSLLVSTHFREMKQLAFENPELFANKHMSVETDDETNEIIKMNYRLADGPSTSRNAIQLFEQKIKNKYPELYQD